MLGDPSPLSLADLGQPSGVRLVGALPGVGRSIVRFSVPAELGAGPRLPGQNELGAWLQEETRRTTGQSVLVTVVSGSTTWVAGQTYYDLTVDVAPAEASRVERVTVERLKTEDAIRGIYEQDRKTGLVEKIFGGLPSTAADALKGAVKSPFGFGSGAVLAAVAILGLLFFLRRR